MAVEALHESSAIFMAELVGDVLGWESSRSLNSHEAQK
jgi:hypothetical protein